MFRRLGRADTSHPVAILLVWLVVVALSAVAFLSGFGQGGLFQRMEASESNIPGTGSGTVSDLTAAKEEHGPTSIFVVADVDPTADAVATFAKEHRELFEGEFVESVADAFLISEATEEAEAQAQAQLEETIATQTKLALEQVQAEIDAANAQAEEELQAQLDMAALAGPQVLAQAEAQVEQARAQIAEESAQAYEVAAAEVQQTVVAEVTQAFEEAQNDPEVLKQKQEAEDSRKALLHKDDAGYAIIVTFKADLDSSQLSQARTDMVEASETYALELDEAFPGATIEEVSEAAIQASIMSQVERDLITGEALSLPLAALIMLIVFGGAIAAGMPLVAAISAIVTGMGALWASTFVTTIDSFVLNVVSVIGLALSIDYGLLVVSRYREESRRLRKELGSDMPTDRKRIQEEVVKPAVVTTVMTAGRTVLFSAITIALSLSGLSMIRIHMLQTIAWGGIIVTLLAVLASVTAVPALLTLLGHKLLVPSPITKVPFLKKLVAAVGDTTTEHGVFYKIARWVEGRPWTVTIVVVAVLGALASPVLNLSMRTNFTDYITEGTSLRTAYDTVQDSYLDLASPDVVAVVDAPEEAAPVLALVEQVSALPEVQAVSVQPLEANSEQTQVSVSVDADDAVGAEVTQVATTMRDLDVGAQVWVGGAAASQLDFNSTLKQSLPLALTVVILAVTILLFLMTSSVVVPIRALLINALSLGAALGATTAIFEYGLFGVPKTPGLETFSVAVLVAFGFGLAMDYEVFLLARIKEYWDAGYDNNEAVALGLQRSGRVITSAAAIIVAVFIGFAMGDFIAIKQVGIALAVMVVLDATIVRMFLVPAVMSILGKWNWWAPKPLRKLADKIGISE